MFSRSKERHVFLFEKVLVLSKKATNRVADSKKRGTTPFLYKEHYLVSDDVLKLLICQCVICSCMCVLVEKEFR